jgi:hypothetical protein
MIQQKAPHPRKRDNVISKYIMSENVNIGIYMITHYSHFFGPQLARNAW